MPFTRTSAKNLSDSQVLIVDDDEISRSILVALLEDLVQCKAAHTAQEAIDACHSGSPPDLVLMDVFMPDINGLDACRQLSQHPATSRIPVIFVTSSLDDQDQEQCWEAGGVDFVQKPVNATTLRNRVRSQITHKIKTDLLEKLIYLDSLTETYNRHYLEDHIPSLVKSAQRDGHSIGVLIFDIDHFKQYNDAYGHLEGDNCLQIIATIAKSVMHRPLDRLIRIGGEEFLMVLPDTDKVGIHTVAERLFDAINSAALTHEHSPYGIVTVSAGLAAFQPEASTSFTEVRELADKLLYESKKQGRNRYASSTRHPDAKYQQ